MPTRQDGVENRDKAYTIPSFSIYSIVKPRSTVRRHSNVAGKAKNQTKVKKNNNNNNNNEGYDRLGFKTN